jgi:hypothetical protein
MPPPLKPIDLCVHCPPLGRWVARKWTALMAPSRYAVVRDTAHDVYYAVGLALCVCPLVEELGRDGLQLTWEHDNRTHTVKVLPGQPVVYQRTVTASIEDPGWVEISTGDGATLSTTFFRLGRYLSGKPEKECLKRET